MQALLLSTKNAAAKPGRWQENCGDHRHAQHTSREDAQAKVRSAGGHVASAVSKNHAVVVGENPAPRRSEPELGASSRKTTLARAPIVLSYAAYGYYS